MGEDVLVLDLGDVVVRDLGAILLHAVGELRHLYCQRLPVSVSNTVLHHM